MIHSNIQFGLIYGGAGLTYARRFANIINEKRKVGYPITPVLVDDKWKSGLGTIDDRIFNDLNQCEYYVIFLTKDLEYEPGKYVSRPNVLLELGMALTNVSRSCIMCLSPFPRSDFGISYLFPSDIASQIVAPFNPDNCDEEFEQILEGLLRSRKILPTSSGLATGISMLADKRYKVSYYSLFPDHELLSLNNMSYNAQLQTIINNWCIEKEKLPNIETKLVFVLERIVFASFFYHEWLHERLFELLSFEWAEGDERTRAALQIVKYVKDYIIYRYDPRYKYVLFQKHQINAERIERALKVLSQYDTNPILMLIAYNYLGLATLHMCQLADTLPDGDLMLAKQYGWKAVECFNKALEYSESLNDRTGLYEAYIYFNRARAHCELGEFDLAMLDFSDANIYRYQVSQCPKFPGYFCTNFLVKSYLSEIERYRMMKRHNKLTTEQFVMELTQLRKGIDSIQLSSGIEQLQIFGQFYEKVNKYMTEEQ